MKIVAILFIEIWDNRTKSENKIIYWAFYLLNDKI